jgi:hypothetical protein
MGALPFVGLLIALLTVGYLQLPGATTAIEPTRAGAQNRVDQVRQEVEAIQRERIKLIQQAEAQ